MINKEEVNNNKEVNDHEQAPQAQTNPSPTPPQGVFPGNNYQYPTTLPTQPREKEFLAQVISARFAGGDGGKIARLKSYWAHAKALLANNSIYELGKAPEIAYRYFASKALSPGTAKCVLRQLNAYGEYRSAREGRVYIRVPNPTGRFLQSIKAKARPNKKESRGLTLEDLAKAKACLSEQGYNWLYLSLWLGLRPAEVDALADPSTYRLEGDILSLYQKKLENVDEERRWKHIPLVLAEQRACALVIRAGHFRRPLTKTLHKYLGADVHAYAGRKGLANILVERRVPLEAASLLLGHLSVETTKQFYLNHQQNQLERIKHLLAGVGEVGLAGQSKAS